MQELKHTTRPISPGAERILGKYFPVLDHGFVALVDYMGNDQAIEQSARLSYAGTASRDPEKTRGLLRYLRRHLHTTPSEMVEVRLHCCMPIFIARQWIRHRTANVSEISGRYTMLPTEFYMPTQERLQKQAQNNKQGSSGESASGSDYQHVTYGWVAGRALANMQYEWMNEHDFARELARIDLPLSTYTQWYWKIDLHNLMHFLSLRVDSHAQWEIQEYGRVIAGMLKEVAPISYEAWIDYDVCGARFSRMELEVLLTLIGELANGGGVGTTGGVSLSNAELAEDFGLKGRELAEFKAKLAHRPVPDFTLNLEDARPAEWLKLRQEVTLAKKDGES